MIADIPASMKAIIPAIPIISISVTPTLAVVVSVVMSAIASFDRDADGLSHRTRCGNAADSKSCG
jgi:hypothetical protein